jgi:hypothetical protein
MSNAISLNGGPGHLVLHACLNFWGVEAKISVVKAVLLSMLGNCMAIFKMPMDPTEYDLASGSTGMPLCWSRYLTEAGSLRATKTLLAVGGRKTSSKVWSKIHHRFVSYVGRYLTKSNKIVHKHVKSAW